MRKYTWLWALIAWVCFLIILAFNASTLHPQAPVHIKQGYDTLGETFCDTAGKPLVWFNKQDSAQLLNSKFHEEAHVFQMLHYPGGCRTMMKRYAVDKQFRFDMELEAYCYADALSGVKYHDAVIEITQTMWDLYDPKNLFSVIALETEFKCSEAYHAIPP